MERKHLSKQFLISEYLDKKVSFGHIARGTGWSKKYVRLKAKEYGIQPRPIGPRKAPLEGKRFGQLTVLRAEKGRDRKHPRWWCVCDCGNSCVAYTTELCQRDKISCPKCAKIRGANKLKTGYQEIGGQYWSNVKMSAKSRKLLFLVDIKDCWDLFVAQDRRCAFTGLELTFAKSSLDRGSGTASLDRIDSAKPYTPDNVQWVHKKINIMKSNLSDKEFVQWCRSVSDHAQHKELTKHG